MKYHALKMEEVNDTMKHLWNKTYQGTGQCQHTKRSETVLQELQISMESAYGLMPKEAQPKERTTIE